VRIGVFVAVLVMAANAANGSTDEGVPAAASQRAGHWEIRTSLTAFAGASHLLEQVSAKARLHLPLLAHAVGQEETTETVIQACWSETTAGNNDVPDPVFVLAALHREFSDLPCTEPDHDANTAILKCDFGNGYTATRSLKVNSNTPTGFEIADEMVLKPSDTPADSVVLHWRIAETATWIGPHCAAPE
jgi:hypothetical protein